MASSGDGHSSRGTLSFASINFGAGGVPVSTALAVLGDPALASAPSARSSPIPRSGRGVRSATVPGHCRGWCGRDRPRSSIVALQRPAPLHARRSFAGSVFDHLWRRLRSSDGPVEHCREAGAIHAVNRIAVSFGCSCCSAAIAARSRSSRPTYGLKEKAAFSDGLKCCRYW